jgi:bifunctional UDP-N-acetylglucosamine pyrophosphorylase/glucosamine-1-phosphate N-acetyltransferase
VTVAAEDVSEVLGVNDRAQLALLERHWQGREARRLLLAGTTLLDPARIDVRGNLEVGQDVVIDVDVIFEGSVRLGNGVRVGPFCLLRDVVVEADAIIESHTVIDRAHIGPGARVGPFARIRPDTRLAANVHIGNFVEIKKSDVGDGSKINHLSYVGDTLVGARVNVGAGTITCNYDGAHKHQTIISDDAFIGSDTQLVAPVTVHAGATIGAGSTITTDAPAGKLTLGRVRQHTVEGWKRPSKERTDR